jgi:hypothetical protein
MKDADISGHLDTVELFLPGFENNYSFVNVFVCYLMIKSVKTCSVHVSPPC